MKPLKSDLSVDAHLSVEQPPSTNAVDPSVQPRERGPRANETSSDSSSAGVAARPALARPQENSVIPSLALRLLPELRAYLDTQTITGDTIGDIRRQCFVPWDSEWNGIVRDETAKRETR